MGFIKEYCLYFKERKKYLLLPILVAMLLLAVFIVFFETSPIAPFIYTVF